MSSHRNTPSKIAIIGAGAVGSTLAYTLAIKNTPAELLLIDVDEAKEQGHVMDITDGLCYLETTNIHGADLHDARQADIIIIAAGLAGRKNESRLSLLQDNKKILKSIFSSIGKLKKSAIVIVVTNPVDLLTYAAQKLSGLPHKQVFGTGTSLDTARLKKIIAAEFKTYAQSVEGYVLGEHGDSGFIAWSTVSAGDKQVEDMIDAATKKRIENRVRKEAEEIIRRKGSTFFGIAQVTADIVEAIVYNQKKIIPVSTYLKEWNGVKNTRLGVPAVIGQNGVERLWPLKLTADEKKKLKRSAEVLKKLL